MKAIADKAINISAEAHEITKNAINQQKNIRYYRIIYICSFKCYKLRDNIYVYLFSDELKDLDTEFNYVKDKLLVEIIGQANEAQESVSMINNDSLTIYRDIYAINLPDINLADLKQNISNLNAEVRIDISICFFFKILH
jgi:hypothetical protein